MTDRTELRRLLDEAPPLPYRDSLGSHGLPSDGPTYVALEAQLEGRWEEVATGSYDRWSGMGIALAAAAVSALPDLLDQLDAAEAALARVRELHERESFWQYDRDHEHSYLTQQEAADESGCDCPYAPEPSADLAHTPECLATITRFDVCSECARIEYADADRQAHGEFLGYAEALWPCPTIAALGGEQS